MLNGFENILVIVVTVAAAAAFLMLVRRVWPNEMRRQHNDLIGWHISVLGSTYAVIIGFMLFAVWSNFQTAETNAEAEANCLVNFVRASKGLNVNQHNQIRDLAAQYANNMISKEWPTMARGEVNTTSHPIVEQLWAAMSAREIHNPLEQISLDHTLSELARMTEYRRLRDLQVDSYLPNILWLVLIMGATVTIVSACLFGTADLRLHVVQVMMLALLISSVLVAIGDINLPFQGSLHVDAAGFERARIAIADTP